MNGVINSVEVFYDKEICEANTLIKNYFYTIGDECIKNESVFIRRYDTDVYAIDFRFSGMEIKFIPTKGYDFRGNRAMMAFVPEHMKNDREFMSRVDCKMYTEFLGFYDQNNFKRWKDWLDNRQKL